AHRRNVLHCDIKPANIVLDGDGNPKLVDFNVARLTDLDSSQIGGTLAYMSPEQLDLFNQSVAPPRLDGRSDIYSLGVVLWELVTGSRPFDDTAAQGDWTTTLTVMARQRRAWTRARALEALPTEVPPGVRQVLLRCLQPEPDNRYADAAELARELTLAAQ